MWFNYPPLYLADRPATTHPTGCRFWRAYVAFLAAPAFVMLVALASALWPADSITTSSPAPAAGSSSTACQVSTAGSSR